MTVSLTGASYKDLPPLTAGWLVAQDSGKVAIEVSECLPQRGL